MSGVSTPSRRLSKTTTRTAPPSRRKASSCNSAHRRVLDSKDRSRMLLQLAEGEDEEPRAPVLARDRMPDHGPIAVIDLALCQIAMALRRRATACSMSSRYGSQPLAVGARLADGGQGSRGIRPAE